MGKVAIDRLSACAPPVAAATAFDMIEAVVFFGHRDVTPKGKEVIWMSGPIPRPDLLASEQGAH